ncbi:MAG: GNAT family N-acetyltransferase [Anaerolineales bacterium]|nr:GNAT family N-acetyltransferase [Anaerolineales bacterium]
MISKSNLPTFLSHYYEAANGPFRNLSHVPLTEAEARLAAIRKRGDVFASKRPTDYLSVRNELEDRVRTLFIEKGGQPQLSHPHYMILGACPWVKSWYKQGAELHIPLAEFDPDTISFTYGDTFPAMRYQDSSPYRGRVYTLDEVPNLIRQFGLPQITNPEGARGPDRYIEAQVWAEQPITKYMRTDREIPLSEFTFQPIDEAAARTVLNWRYPAPYDIYNSKPDNIENDIQYLLDPQYPYFSMTNQADELVAFCTYGLDAQVPGGEYSTEALDIGLGMHPNLTGQGLGIQFVQAVIQFGIQTYHPERLRVTIAGFNQRARRVWEKAGFVFEQEFGRRKDNHPFVILIRMA